ncbi:MAG: 1-deoxy-D-xylulose-5-phosphate synthase [Candidatus Firestonebacteria bacterium RIFOXYC2_FULL_39_67]|nr:MAG: 1-deoxy-D-xylulose-5-phosphate synthase [Candidatus Firestonebacteria bacterium RIFOXYD2_FULL_39_29]OGF56393.1 MAG: 1-deoxy-D-xylulose-5-phosphate synthase [Candidatus Firestonebacteria bacterium RIFOXYC2_FULL_39_67]
MNILDRVNYPKDIKNMTKAELQMLSNELRDFVVNVVSKTGGHLASNLGVAELTVALHYVFDAPKDKIIWDVGHQSYIHKILTGRKKKFHTLRQFGGISGFPKLTESVYDAFETGHSGTSISAALGMAAARDIKGESNKVIAVTGDASLSNGISLEAINNAGHLKKDLIVILNDNEMSIAPNVGAISAHLNRIITGEFYNNAKEKAKNFISKKEIFGLPVMRIAKVIEEGLKGIISHGIMFEELGFRYIGPVDGHDITQLIATFESIKRFKEPVMIHVVTKKGKGYEHAENDPTSFHGTPAFEIESGEVSSKKGKSFTKTFSENLIKLAAKNKKIVAITAAMPSGTGLDKFQEKYPDRFFDVGIAEEHAVTFAAGLAVSGLRPVVAIYSTFMQRSYDCIVHDVAMPNLPVVLALDRSGIVGDDGETHQGVFDISFLSHIPNLSIMSPADEKEFGEMLAIAFKLRGPSAIRYPRGEVTPGSLSGKKTVYGRSAEVRAGKGICIIAVGTMLSEVLKAADELKKEKIFPAVIDARFIKPIDTKMLDLVQKNYKKIVIVEENVLSGGYGSLVLEYYNKKGKTARVVRLGLPDKFIEHGSRKLLIEKYGISKEHIKKAIMSNKI